MKAKNKQIAIQLSHEILDKLAKIAERKGVKTNTIISIIVTETINNGAMK